MAHVNLILRLLCAALALPLACAAQDIRVYEGNSTYYTDCLFTVKDNKVYEGNSTYFTHCLFTIKDGKVYKGNSTYYTDCLLTLTSDLSLPQLAAVLSQIR